MRVDMRHGYAARLLVTLVVAAVLAAGSAAVLVATGVVPTSTVVVPTNETASSTGQTLSPTGLTADGNASGVPAASSGQVLSPAGLSASGLTSGVPATAAGQLLTPASLNASGLASGVPATASVQVLAPTALSASGTATPGSGPALSTLTPSMVTRTPSAAGTGLVTNDVFPAAGQALPPLQLPLSPSSAEARLFTDGVETPSTDTLALLALNRTPSSSDVSPFVGGVQPEVTSIVPPQFSGEVDTDLDGCTDDREEGDNPAFGGLRDPLNFWDFFDTPDPSNARDQVVSASDIGRVVERFGGTGDPGIDPLSPPDPAPAYHTAFDRLAAEEGRDPWDLRPANGSVSAPDIALAREPVRPHMPLAKAEHRGFAASVFHLLRTWLQADYPKEGWSSFT